MQGTATTQNTLDCSHRSARSHRFRWRLILASVALVLVLSGCKVTDEDLNEWGETKDSGRLSKVVADSKQKPAIRVKAALWLVKIRRLVDLEKALKKSSKADKKKIATAMIKDLMPQVKSTKGDPGARALAKDGLFSAWYFADPKDRRGLEEVIVDWILGGNHGEAHEHSISKILDAFGRRGADLMAQKVKYYDPNFFRYNNRTIVSNSCLLGRFWTRVGPKTRAATVKNYMAAATKNNKAALINDGALLCGIGLLGKRVGSRYLAGVMSTHSNVKMKAGAAVALRMAASADPANLDPDVQSAVIKEMNRLMTKVNAGKELDNPVFRGTGYLFHLLELVTKFKGDAIFKGLTPVIGAPAPKLTDSELQDKRTQLRLLTVGFLMRIDPEKALQVGYANLPPGESYPNGYLNGTVLDNAVYVWKKLKPLRAKLLKGLRLGLNAPTWIGKIIAVEGLAIKELLPRKGLAQDLTGIKKLIDDKTVLKGDDWKDATLGKRAKKAIEVLSKKK
jgi:hypothetical protein